jgi:hypothetical protein
LVAVVVVVARIRKNMISELKLTNRSPVQPSSIAAVVVVDAEFVDFFLETTFEELFYIISIQQKLNRTKID